MLHKICKHRCTKIGPVFPSFYWRFVSCGEKSFPNRRKLCSDCTASMTTKKDLSQPLAPKYRPWDVEQGWYSWWESRRFFRRCNSQEKFVMVLPPPNVTGTLHLGHALTCSVQDAIARWHQMKGSEVIFVPGCDHAGIATQAVVERHLLATKGKTRHQLGRQRFVEEVWKWKEEKGNKIYEQMKRLGTALDWERSVFTMDEHMCQAVNKAFITLWDQGLVYRRKAPVNWCCTLQSTISDIEVEYLHVTGPTELKIPGYHEPVVFGKMYDFAYKVVGCDSELIVSTTRPETMLGDTAVMVHPDDSRYSGFVGKSVYHPFRRRQIPVLADEGVDADFGTGVVKVTPAHSKEDFLVSQRHDLEKIIILNDDGRMNSNVAEFENVPRFTARTAVLDGLKALGLYRGCKPHPMMLPLCSRTHDVIETILKPQWFIRCTEMSAQAIQAVKTGDLEIHPQTHHKHWEDWLASDVDWCISRQLWWGHRIPAYRVKFEGGKVEEESGQVEEECWVAGYSMEDAKQRMVEHEGIPEKNIKSITQDEDVLDTWFSSGLYPFAAFGWPLRTADLSAYYPTTLLETGHDILFFWVARMVMLGQRLTGELPFKTVLLHGLVCDAKGHKMSKSRGNIIDPLDIINGASIQNLNNSVAGITTTTTTTATTAAEVLEKDIPECGADALRFTLCSSNFKSQLLSIDVVKTEQNKFLCNKIWQTVRFLISGVTKVEENLKRNLRKRDDGLRYKEESLEHKEGSLKRHGEESLAHVEDSLIQREEGSVTHRKEYKLTTHVILLQRDHLGLMDRWILSQLSGLVHSANRNFETYDLHLVTAAFTSFWQHCLCDIYLESIKPVLSSGSQQGQISAVQTLWTAVEVGLRILSPFMPFLTEELYHRLPRHSPFSSESIMECEYPDPKDWSAWRDEEAEEKGAIILEAASAIRTLKSHHQVAYNKSQGTLVTTETKLAETLVEGLDTVKTLGRIRHLEVMPGPTSPPHNAAVTTLSHTTLLYLHLQNSANSGAELTRLRKKEAKLKKELIKLVSNMSSPKYTESTPEYVQESHKKKFAVLKSELTQLEILIMNLHKT